MVNFANRSQPLLEAMLSSIVCLFPTKTQFVERKLNSNGCVINNESVVPLFQNLSRDPAFYVHHEKVRQLPGCPGAYLPRRWVFFGPYVRFTYCDAHPTPQGGYFQGRLIYEFGDCKDIRRAKEGIVFTFNYTGQTGNVVNAKVRTTRAFDAFDSGRIEDYATLQPFLEAVLENNQSTVLIRSLLSAVEQYYKSRDERSCGFLQVEALLTRPAPSLVNVP